MSLSNVSVNNTDNHWNFAYIKDTTIAHVYILTREEK